MHFYTISHVCTYFACFQTVCTEHIICANGYLHPTDDLPKGGKTQLVQPAVVAVVDEQLAMAMIPLKLKFSNDDNCRCI